MSLKKIKFGATDWIVLTVLVIAAVLTWYKNQTGFSGKGNNKWDVETEEKVLYPDLMWSSRCSYYKYVDLGLPSGNLWEAHNIGAKDYWEQGEYFAWGETTSKDTFTQKNYSLPFNHQDENISDVFSTPVYDKKGRICDRILNDYERIKIDTFFRGDTLIIRRIPTYTDFKELINGCNWWVPDWEKFVVGTSKTNGKLIIFPLTNYKSDTTMDTGYWDLNKGCYWTSSLCLNDPSKALYLCFDGNKPKILSKNRYEGLCLRYIIEKTPHNIK